MPAPIAAYAGIAAVTAIAQAYTSEKARGANQRKLDELRRAFEAIVPPEYDLSINDPPQYIEQALPSLNLDMSRVTPEDFRVIGQYSPEAAQYVAEQAPQLAQRTGAGMEGRQSQLDALRSYKAAAAGKDPTLKVGMDQAAAASQQQAQGRQQSALDQAQRQGRGGSGLTFAAALQGGSDSMMMGAQQGQNAALASYQAKMDAIRQSGAMGRQLSQDDLGEQQRGVDTINDFNQRTSRAYQEYQNQRATMANDAQRVNLDRNQRTADMNVEQGNNAQRYNQENRNRLETQRYGAARDERGYQDNIAMNKAKWSAGEKDRQNDLKKQSYSDQLNRQAGMQGLGFQQMNQTTQQAQDRNQMIQGVGSAAAGYYGMQDQRDASAEANRREDERWDRYFKSRG